MQACGGGENASRRSRGANPGVAAPEERLVTQRFNWNGSEVEAISLVCQSRGKQCQKVVNDVTPATAVQTRFKWSCQPNIWGALLSRFLGVLHRLDFILERRQSGANYKQITVEIHSVDGSLHREILTDWLFYWQSLMMELGFSGINTCPVDSEKNIYLFRDYTWNVFGSCSVQTRNASDHVEWHSNREDTPISKKQKQ